MQPPMLLTLLITWRESFEAALVVGVLLTFVARSEPSSVVRRVWAGAVAGVPAALPCAAAVERLLDALGTDNQALAQAELEFTAAAVLFLTVLWMQAGVRTVRRGLGRIRPLATQLIVVTAFLAVFWESLEMMLFLRAIARPAGSPTAPLVAAGIAGSALAVATVWLLFRSFVFVQRERYVRVASVLLVVVALGLLATAIDKVGELGYAPVRLGRFPGIDGAGSIAAGLRVVSGYNPQAPPLEMLATLAYVPVLLWAVWLGHRSRMVHRARVGARERVPVIVIERRRRPR